MTKVITKSGFEVEIDEECLDDMELLDEIVSLSDGDMSVYPKIVRRIMTPEDKQRLYDHIRDKETGRVPTTAFSEELMDIFAGVKEGKKSLPSQE